MNTIAGTKKKSIIGYLMCHLFSTKAFADEGGEGTQPSEGDTTPTTPSINFEDLIAKARQDEKKKHYGTIENLKSQVSTLTTQHNTDLLTIAERDKRIKELEEQLAKAGSSDEVKGYQTKIKDLEGTISNLNNKIKGFEETPPVKREDVEREVREKLEAEYEVKLYKTQQLSDHRDEILVPELVFGNTKEEIDTSIQAAITRSNEIKKSLGVSGKQKRTPKSASPSTDDDISKQVSIEELAKMDVRSPEYAQLRKQLGLY